MTRENARDEKDFDRLYPHNGGEVAERLRGMLDDAVGRARKERDG